MSCFAQVQQNEPAPINAPTEWGTCFHFTQHPVDADWQSLVQQLTVSRSRLHTLHSVPPCFDSEGLSLSTPALRTSHTGACIPTPPFGNRLQKQHSCSGPLCDCCPALQWGPHREDRVQLLRQSDLHAGRPPANAMGGESGPESS